jgi:Protein of unknown function (DUF2690)
MKTMARLFTLALTATVYAGCGAGVPEDDTASSDSIDVGQSQDAIVYCYAGTCDANDPGTFGCEADAVTVAQSDVRINSSGSVIGKIAIRYSAACRAAWARTSSTVLSPFYLRAEIYRGGSTSQAASNSPVTSLRSPMLGVLSSGTTFRAAGYAGNYYNDLSYATGSVSAPIY